MPTAIYGKVTGPWADHVDRHAAEQCAVGLERVAPIMIFARKRMRGRVLARYRPAQGDDCAALELYIVHPNQLAEEGAKAVMKELRRFLEQVAPAGRYGVTVEKAIATMKWKHVEEFDVAPPWMTK